MLLHDEKTKDNLAVLSMLVEAAWAVKLLVVAAAAVETISGPDSWGQT